MSEAKRTPVSVQIGSAQFLDKGVVHCITKDGKPMMPIREVSVKDFIETKLKKKQINDSSIIFAHGHKKTVKEFKEDLGMNTLWYKLKKLFS